MNPDLIPLLSPKHIKEFTPQSYLAYLRSLWIDPATTRKAVKKGPVQYLTGTITKKGSLVIRCKRDPKQVTRAEVDKLRADLELSWLQVWAALRKRDIEVVDKITKVVIK